MKKHVVRFVVVAGATVASAGLFGCNGQAPPMAADEQKSFQGKAPADMGQQMKDRAGSFQGRPSGGQQMSQNGPGVPPANAVPSNSGGASGKAPQ